MCISLSVRTHSCNTAFAVANVDDFAGPHQARTCGSQRSRVGKCRTASPSWTGPRTRNGPAASLYTPSRGQGPEQSPATGDLWPLAPKDRACRFGWRRHSGMAIIGRGCGSQSGRRRMRRRCGMAFQNRRTAGKALAARLGPLEGPDTIVLGLPRGGVPVAAEVARRLHAPLDALIVRKIGVPSTPSSPWERSARTACRCATRT